MIIRDAVEADIPFVYSSWLKSYRYDSYTGKSLNPSIFKDRYKHIIDYLLLRSKVRVAVSDTDSNHIFGYAVAEPPHLLHYIFIKDVFQKNGIGRKLYEDVGSPTTCTHKTILSQGIYKRYRELLFDPFILYPNHSLTQQGDPNGTAKKDSR